MFKNQKGITLIALVITIIVLLILAGITIALITSNDSAPQKAAESKVMQNVGAAKDAIAINATSLITSYYDTKYVSGSSATNNDSIQTYLENHATSATAVNGVNLFSGLSGVDTPTITEHVFILKSTETVSKGGKTYNYCQVGTIDENGGISWTNPSNDETDWDGWVLSTATPAK